MFLEKFSNVSELCKYIDQELTFRNPMSVTQVRCFRTSHNTITQFPVCPQCGVTMEREYQSFCDRCGQRLDWKNFSRATILPPK